MKKVFAFLMALAIVTSFAAPAFAGTTVDFEKEGSSSIIIFDTYELNLQDVTIEESTEKAHSGSKSVKISVQPDAEKVIDGKAYFSLNLLSSDETSPMAKIVETDIVNFFYYLPEDSNISKIDLYISDEINWDYNGVGKIEPVDGTDEWIDFGDLIDYVRFDEDTRGSSEMPCLLILECHLEDVEAPGYFYLDDFYFGPEDEIGAANTDPGTVPGTEPTAEPDTTGTAATQAPDTEATTAPSTTGGNDNSTWIIVGCVAAAVVAVVAAVIVISKKKK